VPVSAFHVRAVLSLDAVTMRDASELKAADKTKVTPSVELARLIRELLRLFAEGRLELFQLRLVVASLQQLAKSGLCRP